MSFLTRLHGRTAPDVPRWALWAAYGTSLAVLPSGMWRIVNEAVPLAGSNGIPEEHGPILFTGWWYVIVLSLISELLAFLTVGLVASWGEVVPRWVPVLGGRRIPMLAAAIPAATGAVLCTVLWTFTLVMFSTGRMVNGSPEQGGLALSGWQAAAFIAAYLPLLAWGPLLGAVTVHYVRRRSRAASSAGEQPRRPVRLVPGAANC